MNALAWKDRRRWLLFAAVLGLGCASADPPGEDDEHHQLAINGGTPTTERPAIGFFQQTGPEALSCTGTLITPHVVLTARHCVTSLPTVEDVASTGSFIIELGGGSITTRALAGAKVRLGDGAGNDIALVRLDSPIDVRAVTPLPVGRNLPLSYEPVSTYGYGCDETNPANSYLKQRMQWQWYSPWDFGCPGDSGGPTVRDNGDIVATTSAYQQGIDDWFLVFGDVVGHFAWIHERVKAWETAPDAQYFADVPPSHFFYPDIQLLFGSAVTTGCDSGGSSPRLYCPDQTVTKAQMATFIGRATHDPEYVPPAAQGDVFVDVPANAWHAAWVERLYHTGMVTGLDIGAGAKAYQPDLTVSRALMTVYLVRVRHGTGYTPPAVSSSTFIDVPPGAWYARWVEQARADGIVLGAKKPDGQWYFDPDRDVTRAEMAAFLRRLFDLPFRRRKF